ncbi:uncharacterized protein LOC113273044 [Papaver somniferum]|uniref:uncharacterized protein LOC113273044 n=1 Tax=Papaver somniferum TaxID=3469 RepID=UPI000E6FDE8C|nr:uncharacterized protein LOC113273044 [Papaver somniferum]
MTPFKALYGHTTPHMSSHVEVTTSVANVDEYLVQRNYMQELLKESLLNAQERMKLYADKKRTDRSFVVGDWVYLMLQPYRQSSVVLRKNFKLSSKYYGPFKLKKKIGAAVATMPTLPLIDHQGKIQVKPLALLDQRVIIRHEVQVQQFLVQWTNSAPTGATWEDTKNLEAHFTDFILEDKDIVKERVMSHTN